ncbi:hypothetical protein KR093_008251 [Drosophila rubida]|uniref:SBF1/SBF2 domain-containing protein n=1 Tax=Drosophila rubida TaxID=30044 RepID=A0AAD4K2P8_9MUSC|nr:hypothetical protein KR093_008251 [Drosophila rubida]
MVDAKTPVSPMPGTPTAAFSGERSKIKLLMERTPSIGALKSKLLTVLGSSNELINGISNKLTLSRSSSDSDYCDDEEDLPKFDETIDYTEIDFESRRIKARRAHEELISGRYRQPNLAPRACLKLSRVHSANKLQPCSSSGSSSSTYGSSSEDSSSFSLPEQSAARSDEAVSSTTHSNSMEIESRNSGGYERARAIAGARRSELDLQKDRQRFSELLDASAITPQIDVQSPKETAIGGAGVGNGMFVGQIVRQPWGVVSSIRVPARTSRTSNSSTITSLRDEPDQIQASPSMESSDWRNFIRSESQNSVPSWASSISLDCRAGEEPVKEFMKNFTQLLFNNSTSVNMELKSEFGVLLRLEMGRLWFTRFLSEQRNKSKRLESLTLNTLAQYFALALFECGEFEDYGPASVLMNLCFLFYHEVEVPGCDPYREYLFVSLRMQPIWQQIRFWNAAFLDAIQSDSEHRHSEKQRRQERRMAKQQQQLIAVEVPGDTKEESAPNLDCSSSSSHHSAAAALTISTVNPKISNRGLRRRQPTVREREDIVFRQLSAFTCNMHSLGANQGMCIDFLNKHLMVHNLPQDKAKLIRDNINRMYHETKLWGA